MQKVNIHHRLEYK